MARALLAALVLGLAMSACGGGESGSPKPSAPSPGDTTLIQRDPANAGKTFVVGSKNFDEQYILGEIYAQALQAAGFKVKKQLNLGAEQITYSALKAGTISAYPEYSGTALSNFYGAQPNRIPPDPQASYALLKADAAKDGITALPQTPFQNTYVVTSTKATAQRYGNPKTISALAAKGGSKITISGFPECRQRLDCFLGVKRTYHWTPTFVPSQNKYKDLDSGRTDLTFGFGTDPQLPHYVTYKDDKHLFPPYYISLLVNKAGIAILGAKGQAVVAKVQRPLTEEEMQKLNTQVTLDGKKPATVAHQYLVDAGFVK